MQKKKNSLKTNDYITLGNTVLPTQCIEVCFQKNKHKEINVVSDLIFRVTV